MENKSNGITITKRTLIIIIIIILLLICGGVLIGLNWSNWFGDDSSGETVKTVESEGTSAADGYSPDIDPNAADWTGGQLSDSTDGDTSGASGIKIPGYPTITIAAGEENVGIALLNPEGNPCYFTFTIVLKDSGEVLYTSKEVPPGQAITSVTLSRPLDAGEYDAVIQITTSSLENGGAMNGANVETTIIAE